MSLLFDVSVVPNVKMLPNEVRSVDVLVVADGNDAVDPVVDEDLDVVVIVLAAEVIAVIKVDVVRDVVDNEVVVVLLVVDTALLVVVESVVEVTTGL